ncbi:winged helix-turn-helix transcriptional regulator [Halostella sp. JP-L12]|uniref:winged helix-turn-helix transcriptional regulator n=1 Tax=Halostella TaxID=1843185 RepID=UPI000EF7A565|nr:MULTISPECIES: winged helix-turn-helix transcriptional regulator [Halostella]NHN48840.1 winged helix-turn-helix transcriptional regulator [Halostella sp. JP-L12]
MDDDTADDRDSDVDIEDREVEETTVDVDDGVEVEERLEVDDDGEVHEEVAVDADGEETTVVDEETDAEAGGESTKERAVEGFDQGVVDLLSWILDTETRARIYVYLRQNPGSTSEEIAEGTGLYPSTVREALAELHEEEIVSRRKRESEGAGNNPYEYTAIAPSELVGGIVGQIQTELNTVFNLDDYLSDAEPVEDDDADPVTITVDDGDDVDAEGDET